MLLCDTPCALVCTYPLYLLHFIVFLMPSRYGRKRSYNCEAEAVTVQTRLRCIAVLMFGLQADVKYMLFSPRPTASCNITNCTSPCCHQEETNIQTQANKSDPRLRCACVLVSVCLSVRRVCLSVRPSICPSIRLCLCLWRILVTWGCRCAWSTCYSVCAAYKMQRPPPGQPSCYHICMSLEQWKHHPCMCCATWASPTSSTQLRTCCSLMRHRALCKHPLMQRYLPSGDECG